MQNSRVWELKFYVHAKGIKIWGLDKKNFYTKCVFQMFVKKDLKNRSTTNLLWN